MLSHEVLVALRLTLKYTKVLSYFLYCRTFLLRNNDVVLFVLSIQNYDAKLKTSFE